MRSVCAHAKASNNTKQINIGFLFSCRYFPIFSTAYWLVVIIIITNSGAKHTRTRKKTHGIYGFIWLFCVCVCFWSQMDLNGAGLLMCQQHDYIELTQRFRHSIASKMIMLMDYMAIKLPIQCQCECGVEFLKMNGTICPFG